MKVMIYDPPMQGLNMDLAADTATYDAYLRSVVPQLLWWGFDNINNFTEISVDFITQDQQNILNSYQPPCRVVIEG